MTRKMMVAGNWKMNTTQEEAVALSTGISGHNISTVDVVLFPPFPWLVPVGNAVKGSSIRVGAQNCHWEKSGALTGEVSAAMLKDVCEFILVGHSERRHVFGESDHVVAKKLLAVLAAGVTPVLCVGETIDQRRAGEAQSTVARQLSTGLETVDEDSLATLVVAYEPVWAIGTGVAATAGDAQEMSAMVRGWLIDRFGGRGQHVRVLYGGSMTAENALELLSQADIDGGLVGGASLKSDAFVSIVGSAETVSAVLFACGC